ncbi:MAG: hypothetical protein WCK16_02825 [Candidatus Moraniibacteriota bacterium]
MQKKIQEVRAMAYRMIAGKANKNFNNAFDLLKNFPFDFSTERGMSQQQIAFLNLKLDGCGCLGKVAQAGAMVEKKFPDAKLMFGEVLEDFFCNILLDMLKKEITQPDSFFEELLMYEEPHSVLLVDGKQFEPLSIPYQQDIAHSKIAVLPFWEAVTASILISTAWVEHNPHRKVKILAEAEMICPGMTAVKENLASCLLLLNRKQYSIKLAEEILVVRPTARLMYFLFILTEDEKYIKMIEEKYSSRVVDLLEKEVIENERRTLQED